MDMRTETYQQIEKCRICHNTHLECVLDLGVQMLTGVFPKDKDQKITSGPLRLVKCMGEDEVCGLLQLQHSYDLGEMYGDNYGYRSGLNLSMVRHLHQKVDKITGLVELQQGDLVVDIGSNDSTTLQGYSSNGPLLVGIDPTGVKFHKFYPPHIQLIPEFFSSALIRERFPRRKAKVITSFSMFYDLEDPLAFMREIHEVLKDDGVWVFEQSYMPTMLKMNSYDTVCHEHLEYYGLRQIKWMADRIGFTILDLEFNAINGGSFSVMVKKTQDGDRHSSMVEQVLEKERHLELDSLKPYTEFAGRVKKTRNDLLAFIERARQEGKQIGALGASTKGNVLLQYCGLTNAEIPFVGEINPEKLGCYTPGSWIPIISEDELLRKQPDYLIVLPWHYKEFFLDSEKFAGTTLVFPLPELGVTRSGQ